MPTPRKRKPRSRRAKPASSTLPSRAEQKQRTRQAILEAARARFIALGYAATTIREVADAAGVSVGSVHAHFGDKQVLLLACFRAQVNAAIDEALATLEAEAPLVEQLVHCARCLYRAYLRHPALSREMFQATLFPGADAPEDEQLPRFLAEVAGLHRAALARGELERLPGEGAVAAQSFFASYVAVLIGGLGEYFGPADSPGALDTWTAQLRELLDMQLRGLGLKHPRTRKEDTTCTRSKKS